MFFSLKLKIMCIMFFFMLVFMLSIFVYLNLNEGIFFNNFDFYVYLLFSFILTSGLCSFFINKVFDKKFNSFETSIFEYFLCIKDNKISQKNFTFESLDEFSPILKEINNLNELKKEELTLEKNLIKEALELEKNLQKGELFDSLQKDTNNKSLNELKTIVNLIIINYGKNISQVIKTIDNYSYGNYSNNLENNTNFINFPKLEKSLNQLTKFIISISLENKINTNVLENENKTYFEQINVLDKTCKESLKSVKNVSFVLSNISSSIIDTNNNLYSFGKNLNKITVELNQNEKSIYENMQRTEDLKKRLKEVNQYMHELENIIFKTNLSFNEASLLNNKKDLKNILANFKIEAKLEIKNIEYVNATIKTCQKIAEKSSFVSYKTMLGFKNLKKDIVGMKNLTSEFITRKKEENKTLEKINNISYLIIEQLSSSSKLGFKIRNFIYEKDLMLNTITKNTNKKVAIKNIFNIDEFRNKVTKNNLLRK